MSQVERYERGMDIAVRIKSAVQRIIFHTFSKNEEHIKKYIKYADTVSFDVFDTLLKRDVLRPDDVFLLMEKRLRDEDTEISEGFAKQRILAEKKAREKFPRREVTLREIYDCIPLTEAQRTRLMDMECQTELAVSSPYIPMKRLYEECIQQGKNVLFISDMYLPANVIGKILAQNGYTTGRLYVSSESGLTKRSGALFSYVKKQEGLNGRNWLHIGDSVSSDYLSPKRGHICSVLIDREPRYNEVVDSKVYRSSADYRQLTHFVGSRVDQFSDLYERVGYAVLGPLLYGFSCWLEREIPEDETVAFFAREGALLRKAFEIVTNRQSVYLCISRRAAMRAYLAQADNFDDISQGTVQTIKKAHTQKELALSYGLTEDEVKTAFRTAALDPDIIITSSMMERAVLKVIWPIAKKKAVQQRALLQKYFEQMGLSEKCAAVDVGWRGTTQTMLNRMDFQSGGRAIQWHGYYMGINRRPNSTLYYDDEKEGFLYGEDPGPAQRKIQDWILSTAAFFEIMFLSLEGSTESYREDVRGEVCPVKLRPDNEDVSVRAKIEKLQNAGLRFVSDMCASQLHGLVFFDGVVSISNYLAFVRKASLTTLRCFRGFTVKDGDDGYPITSEHGVLHYLFHPRKFMNDFYETTCKALFLKSVFKLPLPYVSILTFLRKHFVTH